MAVELQCCVQEFEIFGVNKMDKNLKNVLESKNSSNFFRENNTESTL